MTPDPIVLTIAQRALTSISEPVVLQRGEDLTEVARIVQWVDEHPMREVQIRVLGAGRLVEPHRDLVRLLATVRRRQGAGAVDARDTDNRVVITVHPVVPQ